MPQVLQMLQQIPAEYKDAFQGEDNLLQMIGPKT